MFRETFTVYTADPTKTPVKTLNVVMLSCAFVYVVYMSLFTDFKDIKGGFWKIWVNSETDVFYNRHTIEKNIRQHFGYTSTSHYTQGTVYVMPTYCSHLDHFPILIYKYY